MASKIIQNYLSDTSIPLAARKGVLQKLESGQVQESVVEKVILKRHGSSMSPVGGAIGGAVKAMSSPANLISGAGNAFKNSGGAIIKGLSQANQRSQLREASQPQQQGYQPNFGDYMNPLSEYGPLGEKGFMGKALKPAAGMAAQAVIDTPKNLAKGGMMTAVGAGQSLRQIPNFIGGALTGDFTDFQEEGKRQRQSSANLPIVGEINPQYDPENTAGTALKFGASAAGLAGAGANILTGAGAGAAYGAGSALESSETIDFGDAVGHFDENMKYTPPKLDDETWERTFKPLVTSTLIGGAIGGLTSQQSVKWFSDKFKKASEKAYSKIFKASIKKGNLVDEDLGALASQHGIKGTPTQMRDKIAKDSRKLMDKRQALLDNSKNTVSKKEFISRIDDVLAKDKTLVPELGKSKVFNKSVENIKNDILGKKGAKISLSDMEVIKEKLYKASKNAFGYESTATKQLDKAVARVAKELIEDNLDDIAEINVRLSFYKRISPHLNKMVKSEATKKGGASAFDLALAGLGGGAGSVGGPVGSAIGAVGLPALKHAIQELKQPLAMTIKGAGLKATSDLLANPIITEAAKRGVLNQVLQETFNVREDSMPEDQGFSSRFSNRTNALPSNLQ